MRSGGVNLGRRLTPEVAERILGRGGDYLLALKGNRKKAHVEVKAWFATNAFALGAPLRPSFDAFDDGHGRWVRRRVFACPDVSVLATLKDWPGLAAVLAVETIRGIPGRGKVTAEIRHYLSSAKLACDALRMALQRRQPPPGLIHHSDRGVQGGFNGSSQRLREPTVAPRRRPRQVFSSRGSCEAWH